MKKGQVRILHFFLPSKQTRVETRGQFYHHFTSRFYEPRYQKCKKRKSSHQCTLLGSGPVKAVRKMLMKLTTGVNFNIILQAAFASEHLLCPLCCAT